MSDLLYSTKNIYETASPELISLMSDYAEGYKAFLNTAKTERESVEYAVGYAKARGFREYVTGEKVQPGDKIYFNNRGKAIYLAIIGSLSLREGCNVAAAHVDAPRLDLKSNPLYEDNEIAYLRTHYYGGVKKYQWHTIPLELRGVIIRGDGEKVQVSIGSDPADPRFVITDILPHLGEKQSAKTVRDAFPGEDLKILFGTRPDCADDKEKNKVKYGIMKLLNEKYGVTEADFLSAELEIVPAHEARDVGLDRSLVGGYGHDDRACGYAALTAICNFEGTPARTAVTMLVDKEEIGSEGTAGMQSRAFERFMGALSRSQGVSLDDCFAESFCVSNDVCNAFDPNFAEVSDKQNNALLNHGVSFMKYTGSRGKSGSNDANAETVATLRRIFAANEVAWQMGELGKVDAGGGGTVALYMAKRNIETIDAGVPVLSMHSPWELISKADLYMTYRSIAAVFKDR
ncbi:MAG: aminopeptidase [Oscillospiraceae bacterium]|jgi:aspartyl aminopeptidase|nr:aminopeptidase [Oscillospiraceae bacterium]